MNRSALRRPETLSASCSRLLRSPFPARLAAALLAIALAACAPEEDESPLVARVGDAVLTRADLEDQVTDALDPEVTLASRRAFVDEWVRELLLYQEAESAGLSQSARLQGLIEQARRDLLVAAYLNQEFEDQEVEVTEEDIDNYYYLHAEDFARAEAEVRLQQILLQSRRDANALHRKLVAGSLSFDEAARQHSLDTASNLAGGDLGHFSIEDDPLLWEISQDLTLNRISKPISSERGYHIVRVLDRKEPGTTKEVEQVRDAIVEALVREAHQQRLDELISRLKEKRSWQIDDTQVAAP